MMNCQALPLWIKQHVGGRGDERTIAIMGFQTPRGICQPGAIVCIIAHRPTVRLTLASRVSRWQVSLSPADGMLGHRFFARSC